MLRISTLLLLAASLCAADARACGPAFPNRLLLDRSGTLDSLPIGSFEFEMRRLLVDPKDRLVPVEFGNNEPESGAAPTASSDAANARVAPIYQEGANAFRNGELDAAREKFAEVLALPESAQGDWGLAAEFSIGRLERTQGHAGASKAAFRHVRVRVLAGLADPQGLGAASFGEEARLELEAGDPAAAIALYGEQASRGSSSGMISLDVVFGDLIKSENGLDAALVNPLVRRLLPAYLNARHESLTPEQFEHLIASLERAGAPAMEGLDRLAAALYRAGSYALAGKLAERSDAALAWWVRAKLALRSGDQTSAAAAYARAATAFPLEEDWGYREGENAGPAEEDSGRGFSPRCRVEGESGVLALSRGDYALALEQLFAAADQYWEDAAHVAERVLSVDELRSFVDAHVPSVGVVESGSLTVGSFGTPAQNLRALLGRRLLRAGRYEEAPAYFADPAISVAARRYADARLAAQKGDQIARAEALFTAASIARANGMELLGFELDPDYFVYGGSYDPGSSGHFDADYNWIDEERKDTDIGTSLIGVDEPVRLRASQAIPLKRYHYRYIAADLAGQAADQLPSRSQAYAAVLCAATGWVKGRDPLLGESLWRRYVRSGPYVPWAAEFGDHCEAPDFDSAARRLRAEKIAEIKRLIRRFGPPAAGAIIVLCAFGFIVLRRRKARGAVENS